MAPEEIEAFLGLNAKKCFDLESLAKLEVNDVNRLKQQVPGWRPGPNCESIEQDFRAKDPTAAEEIMTRFTTAAKDNGHPIYAQEVVGGDLVRVTLKTPSKDGLTLNDFIIAARLNKTPVEDLQPAKKKRYWA